MWGVQSEALYEDMLLTMLVYSIIDNFGIGQFHNLTIKKNKGVRTCNI